MRAEQQTATLMSNMLRMQHETSMSIINNIGGGGSGSGRWEWKAW